MSPRATARLAALALGATLVVAPAPALAASAVERAARFLERAQNADGGFGAVAGASSGPSTTAWAAYGLVAAGRDPAQVRRDGGRTLAQAVAADAAATGTQTSDLERAVLALGATGQPVPADLDARLLERRGADGSFDGQSTLSSFGVLALRAGGRAASDPLVTGSAAFVAAQQNDDGGFGFGRRGGRSGTDDTAAAVQALVAAGTAPRSATVRRAARFLVRSQRPDGGFPLVRGATSNAQSTAWAVQALVAAGRDLAKVRQGRSRTPLGYLRSLQADDGSVRYSRTSSQTPVWVTAQALTALARAPLPIGP